MALRNHHKDMLIPLAFVKTELGDRALTTGLLTARERQFLLLLDRTDSLSCKALAKLVKKVNIVEMIRHGWVALIEADSVTVAECRCAYLQAEIHEIAKILSQTDSNRKSPTKRILFQNLDAVLRVDELRDDNSYSGYDFQAAAPTLNTNLAQSYESNTVIFDSCQGCFSEHHDYQENLAIITHLLHHDY